MAALRLSRMRWSTDSTPATYSPVRSPKCRYTTVLLVPASDAMSSIPTLGPCVRIARSAASTSSRRRCARCWAQRLSRPSTRDVIHTQYPVRAVPATVGIGYSPVSPHVPQELLMVQVRNAVIVGGNRIPFGKSGGAYASVSNQDMLTAALDGLVARFGLAGERVGEVAAGAVLKHSRDFNLTRETVLGSALDPTTPAYDLQQACGTGLETVIQVANKIALGQIDSAIAGGGDSASDARIAVSEGLRRALLKANHAKSALARAKALATIRPGDLAPESPRNSEPRTGLSMGEHQARTAKEWGIPREAQDELAAASHHNMARAWDEGFFDDLVTPYRKL